MPKKKNESQLMEERKKKLAEEVQKKLATVKAKQDVANSALERLQQFRDSDAFMQGKNKGKHLAALTGVHRAADSQTGYIRNLLDEVQKVQDDEYFTAINNPDISRRDLMEVLRSRGDMMPLWIPYDSPWPGEYVGAIAPADNSKLNERDSVAAFSKDGNWILADVMSVHSNSRYECRDVDDEQKKSTVFSRSHLIPLPKFKANPLTASHALFPVNALVLALYPQTTCFYKGIVSSPPENFREPYQVAFEDDSYSSGFCPPMPVAQKYIVAFREIAGTTASTAPKKGNNSHKKK